MVTYIGQVYTTCLTSEKYNYLCKNLCMNNKVQKYFAAKHLPLLFHHCLRLYLSIEEIYANGRLVQFIVNTSDRLIVV